MGSMVVHRMVKDERDDRRLQADAIYAPSDDDTVGAEETFANQLSRAKRELEERTEELARSVASLNATLEATSDGLLVLGADQKILHFNENFLRAWSLPAIALGESNTLELLSERAAQPGRVRERWAAITASPSERSADLWELADGRVLECHSSPRLVEGVTVGRVWTFRDITAVRRHQEQLQEETRVLALLNVTGELLASELDLASLVQAVTDAATALSGAQFGVFLPNPKSERNEPPLPRARCGPEHNVLAQVEDPSAIALFAHTFEGGAPVRLYDARVDARSGRLKQPTTGLGFCSYLGVGIASRGGEVLGGLFFGHSQPGAFDERTERITIGVAAQAAIAIDNARLYESARRASLERQQLLESERTARAAAERLSSLKDEFLANLSHELRTPLNAILGWAEMLRNRSRSPADLEKGLATIERNARIQTRLVEDLLDMSRILSGKVRLEVESLDPAAFIDAAVDTLRPAASAKGVRIDTQLEPGAGPVLGDRSRLQQVIWNLLSNAIKFTPKGGKVQVFLERVRSQVEIRVVDTGLGISSAFLPHVFDRFRQADTGSTRRHGGLGLGLSIVRNLVELHGGVVRAESAGPDQGSTFVVQLPIAALRLHTADEPDAESNAVPAMEALREPPNLAGIKVLIVEDDADSRELLEAVLVNSAATVRTACNASEGLALVSQERPDVLVSDIGMPDVDGFEFLRRLRALQTPGGRLPAIALTAYARSEDRARVLRAGFLAHVAKPVRASELVAAVASVVGRTG